MAVRIHGGVIEESGWQIRNISENYALFYSWNHLLEKEGKKKKTAIRYLAIGGCQETPSTS